MRITINDLFSKSFRIFKISFENKALIDKKFDVLHAQEKIEWSTKSTSYAFLVFVIWHTMRLHDKKPLRKNRVVVDIRELNKISEFDAYFMSLQSDIIFCIQDCKFISIMNCALFFHQWRVAEKDKHKLIVITHRGVEQWNVVVMS